MQDLKKNTNIYFGYELKGVIQQQFKAIATGTSTLNPMDLSKSYVHP